MKAPQTHHETITHRGLTIEALWIPHRGAMDPPWGRTMDIP